MEQAPTWTPTSRAKEEYATIWSSVGKLTPPRIPERTLWDIAVFAEAILRPELATLTEIVHDGSKIHVWTHVDVGGMKADHWEAAENAHP